MLLACNNARIARLSAALYTRNRDITLRAAGSLPAYNWNAPGQAPHLIPSSLWPFARQFPSATLTTSPPAQPHFSALRIEPPATLLGPVTHHHRRFLPDFPGAVTGPAHHPRRAPSRASRRFTQRPCLPLELLQLHRPAARFHDGVHQEAEARPGPAPRSLRQPLVVRPRACAKDDLRPAAAVSVAALLSTPALRRQPRLRLAAALHPAASARRSLGARRRVGRCLLGQHGQRRQLSQRGVRWPELGKHE